MKYADIRKEFREFVEAQPPERTYYFGAISQCAVGLFLASKGISPYTATGISSVASDYLAATHLNNADDALPSRNTVLMGDMRPEHIDASQTFGALLERMNERRDLFP